MKNFSTSLRSITFTLFSLGLTGLVIFLGYGEFFKTDTYVDANFGCHITIEPSVLYKKTTYTKP